MAKVTKEMLGIKDEKKEETSEETQDETRGAKFGLASHPITGELGVKVIVGSEDTFLGIQEAITFAARLNAVAQAGFVIGTLNGMAAAAQGQSPSGIVVP